MIDFVIIMDNFFLVNVETHKNGGFKLLKKHMLNFIIVMNHYQKEIYHKDYKI